MAFSRQYSIFSLTPKCPGLYPQVGNHCCNIADCGNRAQRADQIFAKLLKNDPILCGNIKFIILFVRTVTWILSCI